MQAKTKGKWIIAILILVSGIMGGILGQLLGSNPVESLFLAVLAGGSIYALLVVAGFSLLYTVLRYIQESQDDK